MNDEHPMAVPFVDLMAQHAPLRGELLAAVGRVLDHGQFVLGPEVAELEARWAYRCEVKHAIGVSNGTMALVLVMKGLNIGEGDEVITAPNSFLATASSIIQAGATPRFADVGEDFNLDPRAVRACVNGSTRAILAVHLAGRPAALTALQEIAAEHGLILIEDAAQALGAKHCDRSVGSWGRAGCFSLHPLKNVGACGDGGIITTDDDELAERLRRLRNHGLQHRQEDCRTWGYNARLDTLQAAVTLVKLKHFEAWTQRRRAYAVIYRARLSQLVLIPPDQPGDFAVYHTFPVEADRRDELAEYLQARKIGCAVHYRVPIHLLEAARDLGYQPGDLPLAERQAQRVLSLPIYQGLTESQVHHVCDAIEAFYR